MGLSSAAMLPFGTYPPTPLQAAVRDIGQRLPRNWPGRRLSAWLRSLMKSTARRPIDVTVLGQRMRLNLADNACERRLMVTPHFFDPEELEILRSVVRSNFHFVDLGANVGTYSVFVGTLAGPDARILAVEPQARLLNRLRENIVLNNLDIAIAPVAVGDREGTIEFAVDSSNLGFTSIHTGRRGRGKRSIVRMPMRKLLGLIEEHGFERIDALKADIEGAEDLALLPFMEEAPESLWPRLIILEDSRSEWRRDCLAFLLERGYERVPTTSGNVVLKLPLEAAAAARVTRASTHHAEGLVEGNLLRAHAAGEGHGLDADGEGLGERSGSKSSASRKRARITSPIRAAVGTTNSSASPTSSDPLLACSLRTSLGTFP